VHVGESPPELSNRRMSPRSGIFKVFRYALISLALLIVVLLGIGAKSLVDALRQPTGEGTSVKLAEWSRDHGLGVVVTAAENIQYRLNPPATGGLPDVSLLKVATHQTATIHAPLPTPASPALPGEGKFHAMGPSAHPGELQIAYVRPDALHTSYLTGIAWMSHKDRFVLHPGYQEPGKTQNWTQPDQISATSNTNLLATFNSGFKLKDANGGYYDNGVTAGKLVKGAASFVIYKDGHASVGTWGGDTQMTSDVAFVRQNLRPLISGGVVASDLNSRVESNWGATVGGDLAVWRSGIGVTANADLVYVMGDALSVSTLADLLSRAGAINAMQLDINRAWISFMSYHNVGGTMVPKKMGTFQRPANRYLQSTSRDFIAVYTPLTHVG
jgi:Phosphodiester glycosidase